MPASPISNNDSLTAPERNNYFYGLLLDETKFNREADYFNQKRWLLNRLILGTGVICGLNVTLNPQKKDHVLIEPGIALDPFGHEIVVPQPISVDPVQLTDD